MTKKLNSLETGLYLLKVVLLLLGAQTKESLLFSKFVLFVSYLDPLCSLNCAICVFL